MRRQAVYQIGLPQEAIEFGLLLLNDPDSCLWLQPDKRLRLLDEDRTLKSIVGTVPLPRGSGPSNISLGFSYLSLAANTSWDQTER